MEKLKPKNSTVKNTTQQESNIIAVVSEQTKLPRDMVQRILIFFNFALYTKDGNRTNFAQEYNINNYNDLYEFLKRTKELYKTDHEIEAFSNRYNTLFKSLLPRASAWIFNTFVKFDNEKETVEKYITANLYAASFINRTFGQVMENLKVLGTVITALDKAKKEISEFVNSMNYSPEK